MLLSQVLRHVAPPLVVVLLANMHCRLLAADTDIVGMFGGNAARTGYFEAARLPAQPIVLWKYTPPVRENRGVGQNVRLSPLSLGQCFAAGNDVYSSDQSGRQFALDAANGKLRWECRLEGAGRSEHAAVLSESVFYATGVGVIALARSDGKPLWTFPIPKGASESSPLILGGSLFTCGYDGWMYAIDTASGTTRWRSDVVEDSPPSPPGFDGQRARLGDKPARPRVAASDGRLLFQPIFDQSRILAFDCETGERQWSFPARGWIHANPVVTDDAVLIGAQDDRFYCLNKADGTVRWSFQTKARIEAGAAVHNGGVFFGSCDGMFYRLNLATGDMVWSFRCDQNRKGSSPIYSAPLISQEVVFFGGMEGQVYALDESDGELKWKLRASENSEIEGDLATDGKRLFFTLRPSIDGQGETAIVAIGDKP